MHLLIFRNNLCHRLWQILSSSITEFNTSISCFPRQMGTNPLTWNERAGFIPIPYLHILLRILKPHRKLKKVSYLTPPTNPLVNPVLLPTAVSGIPHPLYAIRYLTISSLSITPQVALPITHWHLPRNAPWILHRTVYRYWVCMYHGTNAAINALSVLPERASVLSPFFQ